VNGGTAGVWPAHRFQLLPRSGHTCLNRSDFAEPAVLSGLAEAVDEISVDLLQPGHLRWVNSKEWASDADVLVHARRSVVAAAGSECDLAQLEVGQKFLPLLGVEVAVLLAGPFGPTAGDEGPMVGGDVLRIDRKW
jgi:hypothetical protein